jgi:hypothetical protein
MQKTHLSFRLMEEIADLNRAVMCRKGLDTRQIGLKFPSEGSSSTKGENNYVW